MKINLFDDAHRIDLLPLTFTRPVAELRVGILTIREKWEKWLSAQCRFTTEEYLQDKFSSWDEADWSINGRVLPNNEIVERLKSLSKNQGIRSLKGEVLAYVGDEGAVTEWIEVSADMIRYPEDMFLLNGHEIESDFDLLTAERKSQELSDTNRVTGSGRIFIEQGARIEGAILNPDGGCMYFGADSEVMEGSIIRGSIAMCDHSVLKLGAKIYGPTTIGPHSKVGGEVNNSVIQGYSNKGHDGFLGNSVLGEWCNLGADTNNSNLKNNYADVKLWNYSFGRFRNTGQQFCGLIMGDHSKCGINTMFNTGTVVGVSSNIFGAGFPRNFIPSFAWGGNSGFSTYQLNKAFETASLVMQRRGIELDAKEKAILKHIFDTTSEYRFWEDKSIKI